MQGLIKNWIIAAVHRLSDDGMRNRKNNENRIFELINLQRVVVFNDLDSAHIKRAYNYVITLDMGNVNVKGIIEILEGKIK